MGFLLHTTAPVPDPTGHGDHEGGPGRGRKVRDVAQDIESLAKAYGTGQERRN